jgi:hypothetical protein
MKNGYGRIQNTFMGAIQIQQNGERRTLIISESGERRRGKYVRDTRLVNLKRSLVSIVYNEKRA